MYSIVEIKTQHLSSYHKYGERREERNEKRCGEREWEDLPAGWEKWERVQREKK